MGLWDASARLKIFQCQTSSSKDEVPKAMTFYPHASLKHQCTVGRTWTIKCTLTNTIYQLYTNEIMQMASKWPTKTNDDLCIEICLHLQLIVFLWCTFSNKEFLNPTYIITSAIKRQVSNCKCERGIFCFGWVYQSWTIVFCLCQLKCLNSGVTF